jgi:hypothetical protein
MDGHDGAVSLYEHGLGIAFELVQPTHDVCRSIIADKKGNPTRFDEGQGIGKRVFTVDTDHREVSERPLTGVKLSRSANMLMALAPPAASVPPRRVATISHSDGMPRQATIMVGREDRPASSVNRSQRCLSDSAGRSVGHGHHDCGGSAPTD